MNRENLVAFYEADLARYGPDDARSLHWVSSRTQRTRFELLYEAGPWDGVSVADVGSGLGDFVGFLVSKGHTVKPGPGPGFTTESTEGTEREPQKSRLPRRSPGLNSGVVWYNGYDINPAMVRAARKKYPQGSFHVRDILTEGFVGPADYVVASGTFNIRVEEHDRWFRDSLAAMYANCRRAVAFNFLGLPPDFSKYGPPNWKPETRNPQLLAWHNLYYEIDPDEVQAYCQTLSERVSMRGGYLPGDHTVFIHRP